MNQHLANVRSRQIERGLIVLFVALVVVGVGAMALGAVGGMMIHPNAGDTPGGGAAIESGAVVGGALFVAVGTAAAVAVVIDVRRARRKPKAAGPNR